ncbi:c-type cytochrome [Arenibacter sp. F20364]|uniref:c-type cytochrome n=1 Tax=Arenibacter sp. F20364 TaxID=2926415 RepID=UPI001FF6B88F|nr:c-type cytochrome [Arenibacter sp. F20364]MCK0192890.1 c-type cytochrome [Arenibacter sp. F20364]
MSGKIKKFGKLSNYLLVFILLCGVLPIVSCNEQARGFALPEGDIEKGKVTYKRLACNECHSISGIDWKGESDSLNIALGGKVTIQKSYGELVSSVINPSHKIARRYKKQAVTEEELSKMKNYNEAMTVQELVDLVTFLQSEYDIKSPLTDYYPYY